MIAFLLRRLAFGVLTLFAIATLSFFVMRFAPGSPFTTERNVSPEVRRNQERKYGFDKPLYVQYLKMWQGYLHRDLGPSYHYEGHDVGEYVYPAMPRSAILGAIAFLFAMVFGLTSGVIASAWQNKPSDYAVMSVALVGICVPNFLLGPMLQLAFSHWLGWAKPTGWPESWGTWVELKKLMMPGFTLALVHVAYISRLGRAGMLDVMRRDYIRTARAKGVAEPIVFLKHGLKNGVTPVLSYAGPMAALIITGSIVVERVFNIAGMGQLFVDAALSRDWSMVMADILIYGVLLIVMNLLVDIGYVFLDPRVRVQ